MTLRESAITAMKELGFSEAKIASILNFMDVAEPHCIERVEAQVPPGKEREIVEIAKDFFRKNNCNVPSNN